MGSLKIDYSAVESTVNSIKSTVSGSNIVSDYDSLLSGFTESKGDQAKAMRSLLKAEKALAKQLNTTLTKFADNIQSAVNEFKNMDVRGSRAIKQGGTQSRKNVHTKQSK